MEISKKKILLNTSYNFLGKLLPLAVAIFAIPIMIAKMGTARFGILTLTWAIVGYFGIFNLGVGSATTKFVAEYLARNQIEEVPRLIWSSIYLLFSFGLLAVAIGWWLLPWLVANFLKIEPSLQEESRKAFAIVLASLPFVFATAGIQGVFQVQQRFALINVIQMPLWIFNYLAPLPVLAYTTDLSYIVTIMIFGRIIVFLISLFFMRSALPNLKSPCLPKPAIFLKLLSYGGWLTVSQIVGPFMVYMDRFLIGAWLSMSAVAYYTTPYELVTRFWVIPASLTPVLFPLFSAYSVAEKDQWRTLHDRSVKYLLLIMTPGIIAIIVMSRPILELWLDKDFALNSTAVLQILALGVLFNCLAQIPYGAIQAAGHPDFTAKLHLAELPIYLFCLWVLIKPMGITGVALAWTIRIALDASLLIWQARRLFPKQRPLPAVQKKGGGALGLIGVIAGVSILAILQSFTAKIIFLPITIIFFFIWGWRYILDDAQKEEVISMPVRIRRIFLRQGDLHG